VNRIKLKWKKESATLSNDENLECKIALLYEEGLWGVDLVRIISESERKVEKSEKCKSLQEAYFWAEKNLSKSNVDAL